MTIIATNAGTCPVSSLPPGLGGESWPTVPAPWYQTPIFPWSDRMSSSLPKRTCPISTSDRDVPSACAPRRESAPNGPGGQFGLGPFAGLQRLAFQQIPPGTRGSSTVPIRVHIRTGMDRNVLGGGVSPTVQVRAGPGESCAAPCDHAWGSSPVVGRTRLQVRRARDPAPTPPRRSARAGAAAGPCRRSRVA